MRMNGNLIDTNVIVKLLNGDNKTIQLFDPLEDIYISTVTAGELFYGAYKSSRINENFKIFEDFLSEYPVLGIDEDISVIYGKIKAELVKKGINIPENDLWIAATAIRNDLNLFTFDEHFKHVSELGLLVY